MIMAQRAQSRELFATARSSGTAVQTSRHNIAVPGVVRAHRTIDYHNSSVRVCNSENRSALELGIVRKDRRYQRSRAAFCDLNCVFNQIVRKNRRDRTKNSNLVAGFRLNGVPQDSKVRSHEETHLATATNGWE